MARWQYQILAEPPNSRPLTEQLAVFVSYPDRLVRPRLLGVPTGTIDPFPRPPEFDRPIFATFPDFLRARVLPVASMPTGAVPPNSQPLVVQLTAFTTYPDRLVHRGLSPAQMPSFSYGTWVPIPNPAGVVIYDTDIHLGTKESTGVTGNPTIGGWQAW